MKSPFPGMDPFIEACGLWEGFHNRLIYRIDEALAHVLPRGYTIDTAERTYVVLMGRDRKREFLAKPDVTIVRPQIETKQHRPRNGGAVAVAEVEAVPMQAFIPEEFKEAFIEIYAEGDSRSLVTCIEVLSPTNKRRGTEGWDLYERKRRAMFLGRANFIEIDLLRGGERMPMLTTWPDSPYSLLVSRALFAPSCRAWPAHYLRRLPSIPVPLRSPDPDLTLDLQPLIDGIYSLGRYDERLDYLRTPEPPLPEADLTWLQEQLRKKQRRTSHRKAPS